jgi:hypothetical protein
MKQSLRLWTVLAETNAEGILKGHERVSPTNTAAEVSTH